MKVFTKESAAFIAVAFIIWTILEIIYDRTKLLKISSNDRTKQYLNASYRRIKFSIL